MNVAVENIESNIVDHNIEQRIRIDGFAVVPDLYKPVLNSLWQVYNAFPQHFVAANNVFASTTIPDAEYRQRVDEAIFKIVQPVIETLLHSYQLVYSNFLTKQPASNTGFHLHQDLTIVDESKYRAYNIWSPLTEATRQNGCLEFVAGSHVFLKAQRGRNLQSPISFIEENIDSRFFTAVELQPGDAVIFDTRILHRSLDNLSHSSRTAVSTVVAHQGAQLLHYVSEDYGLPTFSALKVDRKFFTRFGIGESITEKYDEDILAFTNKPVSIQTFADLYYTYLSSIEIKQRWE